MSLTLSLLFGRLGNFLRKRDQTTMVEIYGEKFIFDNGIMVVCDPECIQSILSHSTHVTWGARVIFENKEYVVRGVHGPTRKLDRWSIFLCEE